MEQIILDALRFAGGPMTAPSLAGRLGLSLSTTGGLLHRMQKKELIKQIRTIEWDLTSRIA